MFKGAAKLPLRSVCLNIDFKPCGMALPGGVTATPVGVSVLVS